MSNPQAKRIAAIVRLRKRGKKYAEIATRFGITPAGARQVFEGYRRKKQQRAELVAEYGARPNIASLPDSTPLEVFTLCDCRLMGWAARLSSLANARDFPIKTLGDLRCMTDAERRRTRNVGHKMAAELRRLCPTRDRGQSNPNRVPVGVSSSSRTPGK